MNPFKGLGGAKVYERLPYFPHGQYVVQVDRCIWKTTRAKGEAFIAEFTVLESNVADVKVGARYSWYQSAKDRDIAWGSMKLFSYAVLGLEYSKDKAKIETDVDPQLEKLMEDACDETKNAFKGTKLRLQVSNKPTKEGKDFSIHVFSPFTG